MESAGLTVYNVLKAFCASDVFLSLKLSNLSDRKKLENLISCCGTATCRRTNFLEYEIFSWGRGITGNNKSS